MDAPPSLHPVLGRLFEGLTSLGSSPRSAVALLRAAGIGPGQRVLDLACGKGAAALAVARSLGCRVDGVDACEPFIAAAVLAASRAGVAGRLRFRCAAVESVRPAGRYDAAMMLGLFPVDRAATLLRRHVKRGGYYLIDDAFVAGRLTDRAPGVPTLPEVRAMLSRLGDGVIAEQIPRPSAVRALNARLYRSLSRAAARVAADEPGLRPAIREFLARQRRANRALGSVIRPGLWLVRRGA